MPTDEQVLALGVPLRGSLHSASLPAGGPSHISKCFGPDHGAPSACLSLCPGVNPERLLSGFSWSDTIWRQVGCTAFPLPALACCMPLLGCMFGMAASCTPACASQPVSLSSTARSHRAGQRRIPSDFTCSIHLNFPVPLYLLAFISTLLYPSTCSAGRAGGSVCGQDGAAGRGRHGRVQGHRAQAAGGGGQANPVWGYVSRVCGYWLGMDVFKGIELKLQVGRASKL